MAQEAEEVEGVDWVFAAVSLVGVRPVLVRGFFGLLSSSVLSPEDPMMYRWTYTNSVSASVVPNLAGYALMSTGQQKEQKKNTTDFLSPAVTG